MATWSANIDDRIDSVPPDEPPRYVLINIGAHDMIFSSPATGTPAEATWIAQYQSALDAMNAAWPDALIYLHKPWVRDQDADADALAGWIDTVVASRSSFVFAGPDERVWMKGSDNGVTMSDGTHYTKAGHQRLGRVEWPAILPP